MILKNLSSAIVSLQQGHIPTPQIPSGLKPRYIIPVDLFGVVADYEAINPIAEKYDLFVLEDAAQSFGASFKGKKACSFGSCAATSFFPAKPLGCYGDGGALFSNDEQFIEICKSLRVHGQGSDKYNNVRIGINGRMDTLQAAIVLAKLEIFDDEIQQRQQVAKRYNQLLKNVVSVPVVPDQCISAWAQYSVESDKREDIMARLKIANIPTTIYYPKPLHLQTAFSYLGYKKGSMPVSEAIAERIFSLPMHSVFDGRRTGKDRTNFHGIIHD